MADDDDDEEVKQPTKYEFSEESKLDEDHLFYLQFTNNFISNVTRPRDFDHCTRWLERLAGEPMYGVEAKRNRNMFLAKLLTAMQDNKVKGPFGSFPPAGPLPNAAVAFGLTNPEDEAKGSMMFDSADRELNMEDFRYVSGDQRTYIATCALPNSSGALAFVGLTFGGGEGLWLNKQGGQIESKSRDRIETVTPYSPLKKQIRLLEEYKHIVKEGLDQGPLVLDEEAYGFLTNLPISSSDSDLLQLGSYKINPTHFERLLEEYPEEFVESLQVFVMKSKEEIEHRLRLRHEKLVRDMYKEYSDEIERGLREYKEARQEWANVYEVVAELKETMEEFEAKNSEKHQDYAAANNRPTAVLSSSLNDAKKKQKDQYNLGLKLDEKKVELHKEIHERALFHMHELSKLQKHVDSLTTEICLLRREARKKQTVIQTLTLQLNQKKN